jgi:hypothetical protein
MSETRGHCLCKSISYAFEGPPRWIMHCHCASCRKATSSAVATYLGVKADKLRWLSGMPSGFASSEGVERLFCGRCGSPVAYIGARWPDEVHLHHGTLADPSQWPPTGHAYTAEQLPWFEVHDTLPRYAATSGRGVEPVRRGPRSP